MENIYYAQPYDMDAMGFYFHTSDDYRDAVKDCRNAYGQAVEEFEIQFIDGNRLDGELFEALSVDQATIEPFMTRLHEWSDEDKITLIVAVGECGYGFDMALGDPNDFDVDTYKNTSLSDLAHEFVEDGLFGDIPDHLTNYIDYDAIARDLSFDYSEASIAGDRYVYRSA